MAKPIKPDRPGTWLSRQAMADVLDVSLSYFDREVRPRIPAQHVRSEGRRLYFYARGSLDAWYWDRVQPEEPEFLIDVFAFEPD